MIASQWVALAFFMLSVVVFVLVCLLAKKEPLSQIPKKFLILSTTVYCSAALLVFIISLAEETLSAKRILVTDIVVIAAALGFTGVLAHYARNLAAAAEYARRKKIIDDFDRDYLIEKQKRAEQDGGKAELEKEKAERAEREFAEYKKALLNGTLRVTGSGEKSEVFEESAPETVDVASDIESE